VKLHLSRLSILPLLAGIAMAACNDSEDRDNETPPARAAAPAAETATALLDDNGLPMPADPRAVPSDAAARTRAGRYASAAQAELLQRALADAVIRVDIECCGIQAAEQALGIAYGMQAAHDLPDSAPVLVRAADLRLGAAIANRLSDAGYSQVWLVTR
jgi:hypothetical protein